MNSEALDEALDEAVAGAVAVLAEHAADVDRQARFPVESLDALRARGLFGLLVPEEYGGLGGSLGTFTSVAGRLAAGCLSTALIWTMHGQQVDAIVRFGSDRLRRKVLPRVAAGELYLASVTTERGKGGHLLSADSALLPDGDGVLIDRDAPVVTGGAYADAFLITARTSPDATAAETSLVYADRSLLTVAEAGEWNVLGMRGTHSVGLTLKGRVPEWGVIGRPGRFREVATESMIPLGHLGWSACWLGAARGAFAAVLGQVRKRDAAIRIDLKSELAQERIGRIRVDLELVGAYLEQVRAEVESAREAGRSLDRPASQIRINTLKLVASELSFRAVDRMVQLAGLSTGYRQDSPVPLERVFRDLRSAALNYANDRLWTTVGLHSVLDRSAPSA
ncbi:acyl-CoA dehydrogenase family protein [Streptomyces sp. URMC 123]|uniref:acyl-CoA dehydrogenase family protein n=1 Tax=Streptomyces sp. URMC 123 TaxID=3423403 RepID=UPI003F1E0DF6